MAAHQAPPSLGFSRQGHWSGLPFPSPMHVSESESEFAQVVYFKFTQSCPTLSDPMDCSLPGSSVHVIFQARVLEWGAIAFSGSYHWASAILQLKYEATVCRPVAFFIFTAPVPLSAKLLLTAQLCATLGNPMNCNTLGFLVLHYLPELA